MTTKIEDLTPEQRAERKEIAELKLLEAKAEKEALLNKKAKIDIDAANGNLTYITTAVREMNRVLAQIVREIDALPENVQASAGLTPHQYKCMIEEVQGVRRRLSQVTVDFKTTRDIADAARAASAKSASAVDKRGSVKKGEKNGRNST